MPQLIPYLSFDGSCREAMTFYQSCLGGELQLQAFADSPMAEQVPAADRHKVLHSMLSSHHLTLFASDRCMGPEASPSATTPVSLCLNCGSDEEIHTLFAKLSEGGTVEQPLADMFWGKYGALSDRFGMSWLFNYAPETAGK